MQILAGHHINVDHEQEIRLCVPPGHIPQQVVWVGHPKCVVLPQAGLLEVAGQEIARVDVGEGGGKGVVGGAVEWVDKVEAGVVPGKCYGWNSIF